MNPLHTRVTPLFAALILIVLAGCGADRPTKRITYHSPEMDCNWLWAEHDRIHRPPPPDDAPAVTGTGIALTAAMIVTAPFALLEEARHEKVEYAFSNDVDDLERAARNKGCTDLLNAIEERREELDQDTH